VEVQDVVNKLEQDLLDINQFYIHTSANSLEAYYHQMIDSVVLDLTVIPVNQQILGIVPEDDASSVNAGLICLADKLAQFFNKVPQDVELDIFNRMNTFPVDDIRQSQLLQHTNMLN
jgi:hypothetical protein